MAPPAPLRFDRDFDPDYGRAVAVAPGIRRLTARNPGPFTFMGTNSYILGAGEVAIVDPGPDDADHRAALIAATAGETVRYILLTHGHRDHSAGAPALKAATGAAIAAGRRGPAGSLAEDSPAAEGGAERDLVPDRLLADGERLTGNGWAVEAIATPGHAADHLAFAVEPANLLLSGDHVMGWSTTVVAPPDGAMGDYLASLDRLLARPETVYLPGHGGAIADAPRYVAALKAHRLAREAAILDRLRAGDRTVPEMVAAIYRDTDPALHGAAGLSVLAHLEHLIARGLVASDGPPGLAARFRPAD